MLPPRAVKCSAMLCFTIQAMQVMPEPPDPFLRWTWLNLWLWPCTTWPNCRQLISRQIQSAHTHTPYHVVWHSVAWYQFYAELCKMWSPFILLWWIGWNVQYEWDVQQMYAKSGSLEILWERTSLIFMAIFQTWNKKHVFWVIFLEKVTRD